MVDGVGREAEVGLWQEKLRGAGVSTGGLMRKEMKRSSKDRSVCKNAETWMGERGTG